MFGFGKPKAPPKTPAEVLQDHLKEAKQAELSGDWTTAGQQYGLAKRMVQQADTRLWTVYMDEQMRCERQVREIKKAALCQELGLNGGPR